MSSPKLSTGRVARIRELAEQVIQPLQNAGDLTARADLYDLLRPDTVLKLLDVRDAAEKVADGAFGGPGVNDDEWLALDEALNRLDGDA